MSSRMGDYEVLNLNLRRKELVWDALLLSLRLIDINNLPTVERRLNENRLLKCLIQERIKYLDSLIDDIDSRLQEIHIQHHG